MAGFSADAWKEAHGIAKWEYSDGKHTWQAKGAVSLPQVAAFDRAMRERQAAGDAAGAHRVLKRFLRRMFPGVFWWTKPDPVERILQLPPKAVGELLADFFDFAAGRPARTAIPTTPSWPARASDSPTIPEPAPN